MSSATNSFHEQPLLVARQARGTPVASARKLLFLLIPALFLPEELSFYIGGLRVTTARAILIVTAVYYSCLFFQMICRKGYRFIVSDLLVVAAALWMLLSVGIVQGAEKAVTSAAILVLEFAMAYVVGRTSCRSIADVSNAVKAICVSTSAVALLSLLDPVYGRFFTHDLAGGLTGYVRPAQMDYRMGLLRASGSLEHPILLGVVCMISLLLSPRLRQPLRWSVRVCCLLGLIFSFSSAPLCGLLFGCALLIYDRCFNSMMDRWSIAVGLFVAAAVSLMIFSKDPLGFALSHFTFDPESSYFRLLIWHYGSDALAQSPLFGIGLDAEWYREDWMPKSVDAFWLMSSMNFGLPAAVLIGGTWITPCLYSEERLQKSHMATYGEAARLALTLNIVVVVVVVVGCTVHYWGATWMIVSVIAGLRATLAASARETQT